MAEQTHPLNILQPITRARSDLYGLLSSTYVRIPEKRVFEMNWDPAAELLRSPRKGCEKILEEIQRGLNLVSAYHSAEAGSGETLRNLSRDWTRLFRGVDRNGISPPYESLYRPERPRKKPVQEVNRLFSQMGIQVPDEWHQPSDYIGVELDFMRLLCEKEFHLRDNENRGALREAVGAENSFLENHLGLWVPVFCKRMLEEAREAYYRGIALLTSGLVEFDQQWVPRLLN